MSITDTDHVCNLCLNHQAVCGLCRFNPDQKVIPIPPELIPRDIMSDREIASQEQSIRLGADRRRGWFK